MQQLYLGQCHYPELFGDFLSGKGMIIVPLNISNPLVMLPCPQGGKEELEHLAKCHE